MSFSLLMVSEDKWCKRGMRGKTASMMTKDLSETGFCDDDDEDGGDGDGDGKDAGGSEELDDGDEKEEDEEAIMFLAFTADLIESSHVLLTSYSSTSFSRANSTARSTSRGVAPVYLMVRDEGDKVNAAARVRTSKGRTVVGRSIRVLMSPGVNGDHDVANDDFDDEDDACWVCSRR